MQSLQDIHDKIFFETKNILETLSKINSKDELLAKQDLFTDLSDRIAFLKILEKNEESFARILTGETVDNITVDQNQVIDKATENVEFKEQHSSEDTVEEEVLLTNERNDFNDEIDTEDKIFTSSSHVEIIDDEITEEHFDSISESNLSAEDEIPLVIEQEEPDYAERVARKERELEDMEERRRKIVEFSKHETQPEDATEIAEHKTETPMQQADKKFKLANIKGLKVMQQLFDNDPLEDDKVIDVVQPEAGSILKSNVKTDFMEAEKRKPEFKLDLNDKVAFSKSLFAGDDEELKSTIEKLNSFGTLEEAKQYLSEVYYQKDWSKKDEFAQRLWNLVESKF